MDNFYKSLHIILISLFLSVFLLPHKVYAQKKKPTIIEVEGKMRLDKAHFDGATIEILNTDNNKVENKIDVTTSGKFHFELPYQHNYNLIFKKKGYYPKTVILTTMIPQKVLQRDPYFPPVQFVVTLFEVIPDIDPSFSKKPVGKIFYSAKEDNFDSQTYFNDMQVRQKIDDEVAQLADVSYQKKLDKAKKLEEAGNLSAAIAAYQEAASIKPGDSFVKDKIKLLGEQIRLKEEQGKQTEEFNNLVTQADEQVTEKAYKDAIDTYNKALKIKPDNAAVKAKIDKVNGLIAAQKEAAHQKALAEEKQRQYNDAVQKGDKLFKKQAYADATDAFKQALLLEPDAQHPKEMLGKIEAALAAQKKAQEEAARQKALAEARQHQFSAAIAKGDSLFALNAYSDATTAFNQALLLQPDARHPKEMLDKIKAALAAQKKAQEEIAQQKTLAEARQHQFEAAVAEGDSLFALSAWDDATAAFNQALKLQPDAQHPKEMLGKINAALAKEKKAQEEVAQQKALAAANKKKFDASVASGDSLFAVREYQEAMLAFQNALQIRPNAGYPQEQISKIKTLLAEQEKQKEMALAEAAKEKKRAEELQRDFSAAVAQGDSLFRLKLYKSSVTAYDKALKLQPTASYPATMLDKVKMVMAEQKQLQQQREQEEKEQADREKQYNDLISTADQQAKDNQLIAARQTYADALKLKPEATYPIRRVNEINSLLAQQAQKAQKTAETRRKPSGVHELKDSTNFHYKGVIEDLYLKYIKLADTAFAKSEWTVARFYYYEAHKYRLTETYPGKQIALCNKAIADWLAAEREKRYESMIAKADTELKTGTYTNAKFYYYQALRIKADESYPKKQLEIVKKAIAQQGAAEKEKQFHSYVKHGDDAFAQKEISVARFYYRKALILKPDESYPKAQLHKLKSM